MGDELTVARSLKELVSERIKASFVELIPEDQWVAMVSKEIDEFTRVRDRNGYRQPSSSDLQEIIRGELHQRFTAMVKDELSKPEYQQGQWNGQSYPASEFVKKVVAESIPAIVEAMFARVAQDAVTSLRQAMVTNRSY